MDPVYIYFKDINIDQNEIFSANFSKENEIEQVVFNKENEYGITGLNINLILSEEEILKIQNKKEQLRISEEINRLMVRYEEPDLTLHVLNSETNTIKISFGRKNESNLPPPKK